LPVQVNPPCPRRRASRLAPHAKAARRRTSARRRSVMGGAPSKPCGKSRPGRKATAPASPRSRKSWIAAMARKAVPRCRKQSKPSSSVSSASLSILKIETPRAYKPLLKPSRYKGAYGGRGSGKSHFFAESLIEDCLEEKGMLAVCIREVQKSLMQSSKRL